MVNVALNDLRCTSQTKNSGDQPNINKVIREGRNGEGT
jgi:hypothetical protein